MIGKALWIGRRSSPFWLYGRPLAAVRNDAGRRGGFYFWQFGQ